MLLILQVKIILVMMVCKIIFCFSQCISILKKVIDSTDNTAYVHYLQSKGLSDGKINSRNTSSSNDKAPILEYESAGIRLKFKRDFLRQNKLIYNHEIIVNIIYEISSTFTCQNSFTLKNYLFGAEASLNTLDMTLVLIQKAVFSMQMEHMV